MLSTTEISALADRGERIEARRKRAEAKLKRDLKEQEGRNRGSVMEEGDDQVDQNVRTQAVREAAAVLERNITETNEKISAIRVRFDDSENQRRIIEENARLDRYEALQIEAVMSGRKNTAVEMKWADLLNLDIPQDLHEQLTIQKDQCLSILDAKDRRIREFQTELKNKDEEYIKTIKMMSMDTHKLVEEMCQQARTMQAAYGVRYGKTEQAFLKDRNEMLGRNKGEMDQLFEQRRQMEECEFIEQREAREAKYQQKIDDLRTQDADDYNKSKMSLERSIQELEQHLEKMMANYQLNKEKLDYNLQVLTERNKEHSAIQSSYKNRLNRLRETLNHLMTRYHKLDQKYKQENLDLTEEYKRITRQFKDLQYKYKHFEESDEKKFREVWEMNENEVRVLINKVLDADRVVHEQQLGLAWVPPREDQLLMELETFSDAGTTTGKSTALESQESKENSGKYPPTKVKKALDLVKEEAAFLLDLKVRDQMHDLPPEQKSVLSIDAILRYVGAENQEDVDLLVGFFFQGQDEDDETMYTDHDDVLRILKDFIAEKENLRSQDIVPDKKKKRRTQQLGTESEGDRKARRRREERKFWERMGHALPDMNIRVWRSLDGSLQTYYGLLKKRSDDIETAISLQKQNEELKRLLDQYLGSKVNEELLVPPTHVIRVIKGGAQTKAAQTIATQ
eukprot:GEMP01022425.1.p1 GENE.GEMP01022425.1~~GEMP01022425.1.p1  ORF type:complete len:682 (+),score=169.67 GEMP01022425.1:38-2083(+)